MVVTQQDVDGLRVAVEGRGVAGQPLWRDFLYDNPQLLLASGFDEVRLVPLVNPEARRLGCTVREVQAKLPEPWRYARKLFCREIGGRWLHPAEWDFGKRTIGWKDVTWSPERLLESLAQKTVQEAREEFEASLECDAYLNVDDILHNADRALSSAIDFGAIVLPNCWKPPWECPRLELVDCTKALLDVLKREEKSVSSLSWQQLEDIVTELLRGQGLEVIQTPRSHDGGRDVIARGLMGSEPIVMAVEVKKKGVVKLPEVRNALQANKDFPALMFVTSGRFSAGVVREKKKPENYMRLLLKDGVALRQWIEAYE